MTENKDIYDKVSTLLQDALTKIESDDIDSAKSSIELASKYMNSEEAETEVSEDDILYGESRNFGIIYNVFEKNVKTLMENKRGRKAIKEFINTIKGDNILKEEFSFYNNCLNGKLSKNVDSETLINETISCLKNTDSKLLRESNQKLLSVIKKYKMNEFVNIDDDMIGLYESIEYILTNKKNMNNITEYINNKSLVVERLNSINEQKEEKDKSSSEEYSKCVGDMCKKYSEELTEDEVELLKELQDGNQEEIFNKYKNETISSLKNYISENPNNSDKEGMYKLLANIYEKTYHKDTVLENIAKFIDFQNALEE